MKTNTSTLFGDSLGRFLEKEGTSEGAKQGWATRRAGGADPSDKGTVAIGENRSLFAEAHGDAVRLRTAAGEARDKGDAAGAKKMERKAESAQRREYDLGRTLLNRMDREGFDRDRVKEIKGRLDAKKPGDSLDEEMRMIHSMAEGKAHSVGEFEDKPSKALEGVLFGGNRVIGAFPTTQENALAKGGTSEGAKLGWETRRGGPSPQEEKAGKKTFGENFLLQPGSGEKFMSDLKTSPVGTTIRDGEGKVQHRKKGDNEWDWLNPTTGQVIMTVNDDSVYQNVRSATTGEAPRKAPAWPSTMHGSPGHKGETMTMEHPAEGGPRRGGAPQVISQPTEAEQASRLQGTPAKFVGGPPAPKKTMENLAGESQDETHGYFGPGTGRNAALDEDVGEALQSLGVKPKEAKEFLYSSMGRHLADSISTLKPGEGKEEIRQRAERHLNSHRKWATGASPKPLRLPLEPFKLPLRSVSETRKTNPIGPHVLGLDKMEFEEDEHPRDASGKFAPAGEAASGKPAGEEKPKEPKPEKAPSPAKMKDSLSEKGVHADKVSGKDGKYKAYFGFFYRRSGESSQEKADKIQSALPEAKIIRHEEHSAPFRGGAPVERQQHWMVEFEYAPKPEKKT